MIDGNENTFNAFVCTVGRFEDIALSLFDGSIWFAARHEFSNFDPVIFSSSAIFSLDSDELAVLRGSDFLRPKKDFFAGNVIGFFFGFRF